MDFIWQWGQLVVSASPVCVLPSLHGEVRGRTRAIGWKRPLHTRLGGDGEIQEARGDELLSVVSSSWCSAGHLPEVPVQCGCEAWSRGGFLKDELFALASSSWFRALCSAAPCLFFSWWKKSCCLQLQKESALDPPCSFNATLLFLLIFSDWLWRVSTCFLCVVWFWGRPRWAFFMLFPFGGFFMLKPSSFFPCHSSC